MEGVGQKEVWRGHMLEPHLREEQIGERINEVGERGAVTAQESGGQIGLDCEW